MGPPPGTDWRDVNGRWELVWSDVAPFRISPFFLTLGKLFGEQRAAEDFFRLHRWGVAAWMLVLVWLHALVEV
jgi:hypothetical protein